MQIVTGFQKRYDWGSHHAIQEFLAEGDQSVPLAEVWYGAHPAGPSTLPDGTRLGEAIAGSPQEVLGPNHRRRFGDRLPFLMKLLAPGRAVSIQVHPNGVRARQRFRNNGDRAQSASTFVDPYHKPEMVLAIGEFDGLVGLRPLQEARELLARLDEPLLASAEVALRNTDPDAGLRAAFASLARVNAHDVETIAGRMAGRVAEHEAFDTFRQLIAQYPGDAGALVSLLLTRVHLRDGEAVFVDSGVPHAYLSGLAVEIMASSDNVFRAGLTSKAVDVPEVLANLITHPAEILRGRGTSVIFAPKVEEFQLMSHLGGVSFSESRGPQLVLALSAGVSIGTAKQTITLLKGQCALMTNADGPFTVRGDRAVIASTGVERNNNDPGGQNG
ncbi:mannose-6-phosphate isomerase, class I [Lacisediminihabitans profunda]|uniref:mannose-6-phosphate isomerase n=1 Tax=Lacisediminihabitans profunda TaxID=2594790 RepID=A0A5C8UPG4_9MICO|nr:mannose-6-phosphate isomerase, class I [Lacisediminihabitans profunda]TXN29784.1 mannose-6-phosphate isomerase, class I [Lacisediminihabitans profunda]